jgi:preprotein translocase subunit SecD
MNFYGRRFNLYLLLTVALVLVSGCSLLNSRKKQSAALRIHIESVANVPGGTEAVPVMRSAPVMVNIASDAILTEANIASATLLETQGGFAVEVKFDQSGSWTLEQYSSLNPGKHFAIFGQWGEKLANGRWLAAPSINRRMAGGTLAFTPDATREEAAELVKGLNIAAKKYEAGRMKQ